MNISFAWTTPAIISRQKHRTRRDWSDRYAAMFPVGSIHSATDRQLRYGGKVIETIKIANKFKQRTGLLTEEDYKLEGFAYLESIGKKMQGQPVREWFCAWKLADELLWVIDFEYVYEKVNTEQPPLVKQAKMF